MEKTDKETTRRRYQVDLYAIMFGIGAWIAVNGMWVELPILVDNLPEGWNLPSYLTLIIQIANVGPLVYSLLNWLSPRYVNEISATYVLLGIGNLSSFLLIFFWDSVATINGSSHSIGLFINIAFLSLVDCTSSVVYLPYMAFFKVIYLTSYFVGEGFSGFIPAVMALIQGAGGNPECIPHTNVTENGNVTWYSPSYKSPRFTATTFFVILFIMMVVSTFAFLLLNFTKSAKGERVNKDYDAMLSQNHDNDETSTAFDNYYRKPQVLPSSEISTKAYIYLLIITMWLNGLVNGGLYSIQSYSCLPYGNVAYHLSVTLSSMANPVACFIAFIKPTCSLTVVGIHTFLTTVLSTYIMVLAVYSPDVPLMGSKWGTALVIISWVFCISFFAYAKTAIANILRKKGQRALFWVGAATQVGSLIGSITMFLLVNVYDLFQSYYPC